MNQEQLKTLWELYKVFCAESARNPALKTDSISSFLGWLEYRDELGNGRYTQGVVDGFKQGRYVNPTNNSKLAPKEPF